MFWVGGCREALPCVAAQRNTATTLTKPGRECRGWAVVELDSGMASRETVPRVAECHTAELRVQTNSQLRGGVAVP